MIAIVFFIHGLGGVGGYDLVRAGEDPYAAGTLWGFDHTAIAVGLTPMLLLATERALRQDDTDRRRRALAGAAGAGLLIAALFPWLAVTWLVTMAMSFILRSPRRRYLRLAPVVAATLAPFAYSIALGRIDPAWHLFDANAAVGGFSTWWALLAEFGPLVLLSVAGRRPHSDGEWMLVLWPCATVFVYLFMPEYHAHSLTGVTVPLSVLAVRGALTLRHRRGGRPAVSRIVAVLLIAGATIPAAAYHFVAATQYGTGDGAHSRELAILAPDQAAALRFLTRDPEPGGVLAPWMLSMSVPEFTDRTVLAGHPLWQSPQAILTAQRFFGADLPGRSAAQRGVLLHASGARFVLTDCSVPARVQAEIARVATPVRRSGCVAVFRVRR